MTGCVHSVCVREGGGVPKLPLSAVRLGIEGIEGDKRRSTRRAVIIYSLEKIASLREEGHPIAAPGSLGENITIEGLDWGSLAVGDRLQVGETVLELTGPTAPCHVIEDQFSDGDSGRIEEERFPGWSRWCAAVLKEGVVKPGDIVKTGAPGQS
jgi:MOSC domain-containing protein YiiM